jgi:hypothetical protein
VDLEGKWKAILIGGAISGLASFIPLLHLACCLIPFAAAIIAVAIYSGSSPPPVLSNNDGVALGAMTGLLGTLLYAVLIIPLAFFFGNILGGFLGRAFPNLEDLPRNLQPLIGGLLSHLGGILVFILVLRILSQLALFVIFGILGGIVGVALFRRKSAV